MWKWQRNVKLLQEDICIFASSVSSVDATIGTSNAREFTQRLDELPVDSAPAGTGHCCW